jgi:hypothetical protein
MHISDLQHIEIATETEVKGGYYNILLNPKYDLELHLSRNYQDIVDKLGYKLTYTTS